MLIIDTEVHSIWNHMRVNSSHLVIKSIGKSKLDYLTKNRVFSKDYFITYCFVWANETYSRLSVVDCLFWLKFGLIHYLNLEIIISNSINDFFKI